MGVQQSRVSVYESGAKVPGVDTLERLIDAAGLRLTWQLAHGGSGGGPLAALTGPLGRLVVAHRDEIVQAVHARGLRSPRVVGRVAQGAEVPHCLVVIVVDAEVAVGGDTRLAVAGDTRAAVGGDAGDSGDAGDAGDAGDIGGTGGIRRAADAVTRCLQASGSLALLLGIPIKVLTAERLHEVGLCEEDLETAVSLEPSRSNPRLDPGA